MAGLETFFAAPVAPFGVGILAVFVPQSSHGFSAGSVGFASRTAPGKRLRSSTRVLALDTSHRQPSPGRTHRPLQPFGTRHFLEIKLHTHSTLACRRIQGHHAHHMPGTQPLRPWHSGDLLRRYHPQRLYLSPSRFLISSPQIRNPASHKAPGWNRKRKSRARTDRAVQPVKWVRPGVSCRSRTPDNGIGAFRW